MARARWRHPASSATTPWPGTDALFWTEIELRAPAEPGPAGFSVRFDAEQLDEPHRSAALVFNVPVVARPEHTRDREGGRGRRAGRGGVSSGSAPIAP